MSIKSTQIKQNHMISIIEGYTNQNREFRVYVNMNWVTQFPTREEAEEYVKRLKEEKASIADDEHQK